MDNADEEIVVWKTTDEHRKATYRANAPHTSALYQVGMRIEEVKVVVVPQVPWAGH